MALNKQVVEYLRKREARNLPATHTQSPEEHRRYLDAGPFPAGPELCDVREVVIDVARDMQIGGRIYRPNEGEGQPGLVFFHGGGWLCGTLDSVDGTLRHLSKLSGNIILSVDYRRSPEHKYPAPFDDCYTAVHWMKRYAHLFGCNAQTLAVGGFSAGGNLAAAVSLKLRDSGQADVIDGQLLCYPCLNPACMGPSYWKNAKGYVLTTLGMRWYWNHYLAKVEDASDPYAAPLHANDLSGLPPALIMTAEFDPLLDDGFAYADKLRAANADVAYKEYGGMVHGFLNQWDVIDMGMTALWDAAEWLRSLRVNNTRES